jgi:cytoskeletal protein RodZ
MKITYALALAGVLAFSGSAFAASSTATTTDTTVKPATATTTTTTTATAAATKPTAATTKVTKPVTTDAQKQAISKKCSADADAKGLHGKDRKKFREQCKTAAAK